MKINVMILISAKNISGPVKGVLQLVKNLDRDKFNFKIFNCLNDVKDKDLFSAAKQDKNFAVIYLIRNNGNYFSLIRKFLKEIQQNNFDIVQSHGFLPSFLSFFARLFCNIKWICFMHGTTNENLKVRMYNLADNLLQRASHRTILVSEAQRKKVFGGRNIRRVNVLHNAVDVTRPVQRSEEPPLLRKIYCIPNTSKIVVAIGRFSPEKGIDILLEAFALLLCKVPNTHLILVGDGQEREALEAQAHRLKVLRMVHFAGYSETPGDYLSIADVFVLPSRSEGIPNALLESMANGTPVVASDVGGVSEIIEDGINGRLVPPEQPAMLAYALSEVLNDTKLRQRFSIGGRQRVCETFKIEDRLSKLHALYRNVLAER